MKILYVTTIGGTMSFFKEHFKMLLKQGHTVELACNLSIPIRDQILDLNLKTYNISFSRNPFSKNNLKAYIELKELLKENRYDIVHCHTPNASVITRLACREFRKKGVKVIYTAHGFHFYKGAPLKNWLFYYPMEWICSFLTDTLITINQEDYQLSKRHMHSKNIEYIPGVGIDLEYIESIKIDKDIKRKELGLLKDDFIFLSVGELNTNKNHITVIKAIEELVRENKINNFKYLICGEGNKRKELEEYIKNKGLEQYIKLLGFRKDVLEILKITNCFIFPSIREGLGLAAIEAMASGVPIIVSNNRGSQDFADKDNTFICDVFKVDQYKESILKVINNKETRKKMSEYGIKKSKDFGKDVVLNKLMEIYGGVINGKE